MQSELIYRTSRFGRGKGRLFQRVGIWSATLLVLPSGILTALSLRFIFSSWINLIPLFFGHLLLVFASLIFFARVLKRSTPSVLIVRANRMTLSIPTRSWKVTLTPKTTFRILHAPGILMKILLIDEPGKPTQRLSTTLKLEQLTELRASGRSVSEKIQWGSYSALALFCAPLRLFLYENTTTAQILLGAVVFFSFLIALSENRKSGVQVPTSARINAGNLFMNRTTLAALALWCLGIAVTTKAYAPYSHYDREIMAVSAMLEKDPAGTKVRLEALLTDHPEARVQNSLAWLLTTTPDLAARDYARAISLAKLAVVKIATQYPGWDDVSQENHKMRIRTYQDTLACAEMGKGNTSRAMEIAREQELKDRVELFTRGGLCEMTASARKTTPRGLATAE